MSKESLRYAFEEYKKERRFHRKLWLHHQELTELLGGTIIKDKKQQKEIVDWVSEFYKAYCERASAHYTGEGEADLGRKFIELSNQDFKDNISKMVLFKTKVVQTYFDNLIKDGN